MWTLDFPEQDPDSNYLEPSRKQLIYADQARSELRQLKSTLEKVTVPQERAILVTIANELVGGVYRREPLRLHPHQAGVSGARVITHCPSKSRLQSVERLA
jgi:hypothetical protein